MNIKTVEELIENIDFKTATDAIGFAQDIIYQLETNGALTVGDICTEYYSIYNDYVNDKFANCILKMSDRDRKCLNDYYISFPIDNLSFTVTKQKNGRYDLSITDLEIKNVANGEMISYKKYDTSIHPMPVTDILIEKAKELMDERKALRDELDIVCEANDTLMEMLRNDDLMITKYKTDLESLSEEIKQCKTNELEIAALKTQLEMKKAKLERTKKYYENKVSDLEKVCTVWETEVNDLLLESASLRKVNKEYKADLESISEEIVRLRSDRPNVTNIDVRPFTNGDRIRIDVVVKNDNGQIFTKVVELYDITANVVKQIHGYEGLVLDDLKFNYYTSRTLRSKNRE